MDTECIYCGCDVEEPAADLVPEVDDDDTWELIAESHAAQCEWVLTRAHRQSIEDGEEVRS